MKSRKLRGGILGTTTQGLIKKLNKFYGDLDDNISNICRKEEDHACLLRVQPKTPLQQKLRGIMDKFNIAEGMEKSIFSNLGHIFTKSKNYFSKSNSLNVSSIEEICNKYLDALLKLLELVKINQGSEDYLDINVIYTLIAAISRREYKEIDRQFNTTFQDKLKEATIKIIEKDIKNMDNLEVGEDMNGESNRDTITSEYYYDASENPEDPDGRNFNDKMERVGGTSNSRRKRKRKPKTKRKLKTRRRRRR